MIPPVSDCLGGHGSLMHGGRLYMSYWIETPEPAGLSEAI